MRKIFYFLVFLSVVLPLEAKTIKSKYFDINFYGDVNLIEFLKKINVDFINLDDIFNNKKSLDSLIAESIDNLYLEVSSILDIHIYSYRGTINIFHSKEDFDNAIYSLGINNSKLSSIFLPDNNTIYILENEFTLGMLAHEIAHAITCNYFITPPPEKVSEILSGYVEYSILKRAKRLNN